MTLSVAGLYKSSKLGFSSKRIISAVKRAEFVSDRMSYIILRGRWYDIIVLNVHARTEDKNNDMVTCLGFRD
jgi:hypothetical protein